MSQTNGGERRFDRVGCSQVCPVRGREVVEGEQHVTVLPQALARGRILGVVLGQEVIEGVVGILASLRLPDVVKIALGPRLHALRQLAQHIARLVEPAALLGRLTEDLAQGGPEAERSVTDGQLRCHQMRSIGLVSGADLWRKCSTRR